MVARLNGRKVRQGGASQNVDGGRSLAPDDRDDPKGVLSQQRNRTLQVPTRDSGLGDELRQIGPALAFAVGVRCERE
jgi:hypothetical protein